MEKNKQFNKLMGCRIREFRREQLVSQSHLARRVGVSQSFISKIESGELGLSLEVAGKIASAFKISLKKLAGLGYQLIHI